LSTEEHALQSEIAAFQQYSENGALDLEQVRRDAADKRREAEVAAAELEDAHRASRTCTDEHLRSRTRMEQLRLRLSGALGRAALAATSAGLDDIHRSCFDALDIQSDDDVLRQDAQVRIAGAITTQLELMEQISILNERMESAKNDWQRAS